MNYIGKQKLKEKYPEDITIQFERFENEKLCLEIYEEYEEAKRKAIEEAERIAKEKEEEQKRILAEEEKAAAEKARLEAQLVERMKRCKMREPAPVVMPLFNRGIDPIIGLDMYIEDIDKYFDKVDDILSGVTSELQKFKANSPFKVGRWSDIGQWSNARRNGMVDNGDISRLLRHIL